MRLGPALHEASRERGPWHSALVRIVHSACLGPVVVHDRRVLPIALSIAGSDPSGGAGIQADLKTFQAHRVYGMGVITLLTVQNTWGVRRVEPVAPELVGEQLDALFADRMPSAAKTGALGSAAHVRVIAERFSGRDLRLIVDPVIASKHGVALLDEEGCGVLQEQLFPLATLITPNLDEAELLLGQPVRTASEIEAAARAFVSRGARAVLLKGGHREGAATDVLFCDGALHELSAPRVETRHTHGVGCTLSAAITARLALGHGLLEACSLAKAWLTRAIETAPGIGHGQGAVNHLAPLPEAASAIDAPIPAPPPNLG